MTKLYGQADPAIAQYVTELLQPEDAILAEIRQRATTAGLPDIHVSALDGLHLEVLARACAAKKMVEIGTLAGYSSICLARALPSDGKLYCFELEPRYAAIAQTSFQQAGFADQIEIFIGPALDNLPSITKQGPFDLIFIDANKSAYPAYLDWATQHLRIGGVVLADNTFAKGHVTDTKAKDNMVNGIKIFNQMATQSGYFRTTILPTGVGLTVAVKIK